MIAIPTQDSKDSLITSGKCGIVTSMSTVQIELPEELFALANVSGTPSRSASKLIALELFRERRVSAGKAAELAGVSLDEFLEFSAHREVPMHYTAADWEQDQAVARKLKL